MADTPVPPTVDQIGFFKVAGLVRTILVILVPCLTLHAIVMNLMIRDQTRSAIDALRDSVVDAREFERARADGDRIHREAALRDEEFRRDLLALQNRVRDLEEGQRLNGAKR